MYQVFMAIAVWTTKKNQQKHSNCKPGKISDCHCLPSLWLKMPWAWHLQIFFTAAFRTQKLGLHYAPVMNFCIFLFFCFHVSVSCSVMSDSVIPQTVACQAPLSMEFSRQGYWSGLPFPSPGDLPDLVIEPGSSADEAGSLLFEPPGKPIYLHRNAFY